MTNGVIDNNHRPQKAAIMAYETRRWTEVLPIVLLGFTSALTEDVDTTLAKPVCGTTLRLPGLK